MPTCKIALGLGRTPRAAAAALADPRIMGPGPDCRLCGGPTSFAMFQTLLGKYLVTYHVCSDCASLQTERPYWLDEAYAPTDIRIDTGMCQRTLQLVIETCGFLSLIHYDLAKTMVDFGGGNGLFTRMMVDRGFDAHCYDRYGKPFYAPGRHIRDIAAGQVDVFTAFEVFEHMDNPAAELDLIFGNHPELVIFTTDTYSD